MNQQEWNDLLNKWTDKGVKAARHDTWMEPCYEEDAGQATSLDELVLTHRQQWETTDHFQVFYGQKMTQDVVGVGQATDWEARLQAKLDLLDAFWDAWESEVGAYELARKAMESA